MPERLLSTDPAAGQLLSTDPSAGSVTSAIDAHPEAVMRAPTNADAVTLGELLDNPTEAIGRIGSILQKDATNPKTWLTLATAYFGPKVVGKAMPVLGTALMQAGRGVKATTGAMGRGLAATGDVISPDVVGIYSPRVANAMRAAQAMRGAARGTEPTPVAPMPMQPGPVRPPIQVEALPEAMPAPVAHPGPRTINEAMAEAVAKAQAKKPLATAMNEVQAATKTAKVKLTATETKTAMDLVREGRTPQDALDVVVAMRSPTSAAAELAKRFGTPSDASVAEQVSAANARTTRAKGGTKD